MRRGFNRYQQSFPFDENGGQEASSLRVSSGNDMLASLCRIVEEHSRVLQQLISTSELFTNRSL